MNFATSRAQDLNEIPSVLVASSVVAIGYYDHMSEGQARDQRCEESDGHPVFENGPSFHPNHDDLPIEIISERGLTDEQGRGNVEKLITSI